jgi:DNA/RNA endonuclease YhcR with UshA esterase domain
MNNYLFAIVKKTLKFMIIILPGFLMKLKFILIISFVIFYSITSSAQVKIKSYQAKNFIGKKVIVSGYVAQISETKGGDIILNLGERFRLNELTAVINKSDIANFRNIILCSGRNVEISGTITGTKGSPQIILRNTIQIKIIN